MKSLYLDITKKLSETEIIKGQKYLCKFTIKILESYSIEHFYVQLGAMSLPNCGKIIGSTLEFDCPYSLSDMDIGLTIYYHGIRDYENLFYWISGSSLKKRLGEFYEEAEKNFNFGSKLSFILMCGAIFEGILVGKGTNPGTFEYKIDTAFLQNIINDETKITMHNTRRLRNLVHGNNHNDPYPTRIDFMDTRNILDKLILSFT